MPRTIKYASENLMPLKMFPTYQKGERLIYFGAYSRTKATICVGIGTLLKVQKGNKFDIITMDFGRYQRKIIVKLTQARKMVYTMKVNQLAWFVGTRKTYNEGKGKDRKVHSMFYAIGFQGWYVPNVFDIKQVDPQDIVEEKLEKKAESQFEIINKIINGGNI